jgi:hypothetical protein
MSQTLNLYVTTHPPTTRYKDRRLWVLLVLVGSGLPVLVTHSPHPMHEKFENGLRQFGQTGTPFNIMVSVIPCHPQLHFEIILRHTHIAMGSF